MFGVKPEPPKRPVEGVEGPSLEKAYEKALVKLPLDSSGKPFQAAGNSETEYALAFEELGLGVTGYMLLLKHWHNLAGLCLLLCVPSMVSNAYGHALDDMQTSFTSWFFTVTTLGNTDQITPAYGATEFCISCIITVSLFRTAKELKVAAFRAEKHKISDADFALEVEYKPSDVPPNANLRKTIENALYKELRTNGAKHIATPLKQRELKLLVRNYNEHTRLMEAREEARQALNAHVAKGQELDKASAKRLKKLEAAKVKDEATEKQLGLKIIKAEANTPPRSWCGLAYVTMINETYVQKMLNKTVEVEVEGGGTLTTFTFRRPPEPTDIIWANLGFNDNLRRQFLVTCECALLSLVGSAVIGVVTFLQQTFVSGLDNESAKSVMNLIGTVAVIASYLLIFIFVPQAEESQMRHKTITNREQSQVVKLVVFQVIATIATSTVFLVQTGGAFTREWYMTGGFLVINGMMVDLFVITVLVQGYQLPGVLIPQFIARHFSPPLTQYEADLLMAPKGDMYITDRLQMVTKFVCMTYIYASAMPLLWGILFLVCAFSRYLDTRNLLRVLQPPPQSGVAQVRVILAHVMPVVALLHLVFQFFMLEELMDGINRDWVADFNEALVSFSNTDLSSVASSVIAGVTNASAALVQSTEAGVQSVGNMIQSTSDVKLMTSSFDVDHNHGDDAMALVHWSIYVNAPIIIFFFLNKWRQQFGLPSLADKLQVKQMEKLVASVGKEAAKLASESVTALAKAAKVESAAKSFVTTTGSTVKELTSAFQGLQQMARNDEFDKNRVKDEAAGLEYSEFCKKFIKPERDPNIDPYKPITDMAMVDETVKKVKEKYGKTAEAQALKAVKGGQASMV